jgi:glycosyltransferase involved in cell wall biosynthesis
LVSVLMGSYNHEKYVAQAIESVLNQTFSDFEFIIVDDGSADNSRAVIEKFQTQDSRIRAFFHQKNLGISKTINECLKQAGGEYVSFIGSDDLWIPYKLERQLAVIKNCKDKIVWSEGQVINGIGAFTGQTVTQHMLCPKKKSGDLFQELLREDVVFGQSTLFRTKFAQEIAFNENLQFVADHQFFVELAKQHEFVFIPEPLATYRVHGENSTLKNEKVWFKERIILRNRFLDKYCDEISRQSMADIYYKIGHAYSGLSEKALAQQFYLKAVRTNPLRANTLLYLILALTNGDGAAGEFLQNYYQRLTSLLIRFSEE